MVDKNPNLPQSYNNEQNTPLYAAATEGLQSPKARKEMVWFLVGVTTDEGPTFAFTGECAGKLIVEITNSGFYDITFFLLERYPRLAAATYEGKTIFHGLAEDPSSFQEGTWNINRPNFPVEITKLVCASARNMDFFPFMPPVLKNFEKCLIDALHLAIMNGVIQMVQVCLEYLPNVLWTWRKERTLLHVAIEYRQWKVYNYLIEIAGGKKSGSAYLRAPYGGNILHFAARMPSSQLDSACGSALQNPSETSNILHFAARMPSFQLDSAHGSALQMQQELQWFKAVEKLVDTRLRFGRDKDGRTPQEIFAKDHKDLLRSGGEWMKSTSNACMVVAALAATIVFAAIITVPGGLDDETGRPKFLGRTSFTVYAVSVAVALFSSMTSLLTFILIHTSRFAEEDFLVRLPTELMVSVAFLLIAIIAVTVAFFAAVQFALHIYTEGWIYAFCFPVLVCTMKLYGLFFGIFKSTYRPMVS